jgi:hypothetical protein
MENFEPIKGLLAATFAHMTPDGLSSRTDQINNYANDLYLQKN